MASIEAFRICLLPAEHALPPQELSSRQTKYEGALRRLLAPLKIGHRLEFMTADTSDGLWQIATITSSGQRPLPDDAAVLDYLDPELHREATTAGNLVSQTFAQLARLIEQHSFTPSSFENFCMEHFGRLESEQIKPLLRAAMQARDSMEVTTPSGDHALFNLGDGPQLITDEKPMQLRLKVLNISRIGATVKPHRQSARQLKIRPRQVELSFEAGLTCKSAIGRKLFKALQQESFLACTVLRVFKASGEFHSLLLPMTVNSIE